MKRILLVFAVVLLCVGCNSEKSISISTNSDASNKEAKNYEVIVDNKIVNSVKEEIQGILNNEVSNENPEDKITSFKDKFKDIFEKIKTWYIENKDEIKDKRTEILEQDKEQIKEACDKAKDWYEENKDELKDESSEILEENKNQIKEVYDKAKDWYEENKDDIKNTVKEVLEEDKNILKSIFNKIMNK